MAKKEKESSMVWESLGCFRKKKIMQNSDSKQYLFRQEQC